MYSRILVPLDGSTFSEAALPLALALSRRTGAELHLVSVVEPVPAFSWEEWESSAREWSREYLEKLTSELSPHSGGPIQTAVVGGHVVDELQREASERNVDLVAMATHGRGALTRAWLGSVADRFVRHADRPVLLVRPEEDEEAPAGGERPRVEEPRAFERILIPLDGSDLSESALEHAVEFGRLFDASYHLTRIVAYPVELASPYLPHTAQMNQALIQEAQERATEYLAEQAGLLSERGLRVTTSVSAGTSPARGILEEASEAKADCIAMATHGRTGLGRALLGSTADKVLRGTHLPLLLYRSTGRTD